MTFLQALPILIILFGTPLILIFGLGVRWYRNYQAKKFQKEHAEELAELERQYNEIVGKKQ